MIDIKQHPCFSKEAKGEYARVHLPVAPKCNIQCNYCKRGYDCVNESRPGVTSKVLLPGQALVYLIKLKEIMPHLSVVGVAGPGDPFANPVETMSTLRLVRQEFPEIILCLSTNGLNILPYIEELAALEVSHVTITLNGLDGKSLSRIYKWVRFEKRGYLGETGAKLLLGNQLEAIKTLKGFGITTKVNTIVIPGVNDHLMAGIAEKMKELKVDLMNAIPIYPVKDTVFEDIEEPTPAFMKGIRSQIEQYIPPMTHCSRCRADAVGLLGKDGPEAMRILNEASQLTVCGNDNRPFVAVASYEGMLVNQHLGEADELYIFRETPNGYRVVEQRKTPPSGAGARRWESLARLLTDCRALLVGGIGPKPSSLIGRTGIRIVEMTGLIDQGLDAVYKGLELKTIKKADAFKCGDGCSGTGVGCG
ncbi:Nitrogenase FeMo-cofactor synthesis FeS core scaffold and assembly protein NifB [hydrothermal vent metagenome]|uniref:FeMo cofactor biosynthesis protein NifB n=1 Tax=hydrothermal vent metagenome TaxID=652676 RepID=A0A3B0TUJ0_9ZZZZ